MTEIKELSLKTKGHTDIINITEQVESIIEKTNIKKGLVNIHCPGATGGVSTIEFEPGLLKDIPSYLEKYFPYKGHYEHHNKWGDDNGSAHVRSFLLKTSLTVPFNNQKLILGTWQSIVFIDFDTRSRSRSLVVTIIGD